MSVDEQLSAARAQLAAISREHQERRGLREQRRAEAEAEADARRAEEVVAVREEILARTRQPAEAGEQNSAAAGWGTVGSQKGSVDDDDHFGFEADESFRGQPVEQPPRASTWTPPPDAPPGGAPASGSVSPTASRGRHVRPPAPDDDDFANTDWTTE